MNIKEEKNFIVYRIENAEQEGPYSYAFNLGEELSEFWQTRPHNKKHGCPSPEEDGFKTQIRTLVQTHTYFLFGFSSMKQLKAWFTPQERKTLFAKGFRIKKYQAKLAYISAHQVLFIPKQSIIKGLRNYLNNF